MTTKLLPFFVLIIALMVNSNAQSQKVKCLYCKGVGKVKDTEREICRNCWNWNESYRSKVACNICKDTRYIDKVVYEKCYDCSGTGFLQNAPWYYCLERVRIKQNRFKLLKSYDDDNKIYMSESVLELVDGVATDLSYYNDGTVLWRKTNSSRALISTGKWKCINENEYHLIWDDGEISKVNSKDQ